MGTVSSRSVHKTVDWTAVDRVYEVVGKAAPLNYTVKTLDGIKTRVVHVDVSPTPCNEALQVDGPMGMTSTIRSAILPPPFVSGGSTVT
jgi:hypothetical protein